jgi:hypothetical protein
MGNRESGIGNGELPLTSEEERSPIMAVAPAKEIKSKNPAINGQRVKNSHSFLI